MAWGELPLLVHSLLHVLSDLSKVRVDLVDKNADIPGAFSTGNDPTGNLELGAKPSLLKVALLPFGMVEL